MLLTKKSKVNRNASSTRLTILLLVLLILSIGCVYEFFVARPAYNAAWDEIKKIDASGDSSNYTSEHVRELIGEPVSVNDTIRSDSVVYTYRWPSGLLVKNHEVKVVFTKINPLLSAQSAKNVENQVPTLYYYSAVAGQPLDLEANFPTVKKTIVQNLNPPPVVLGDGPGLLRPAMPWKAVETLLYPPGQKDLPAG